MIVGWCDPNFFWKFSLEVGDHDDLEAKKAFPSQNILND